MAHRLYLLVTLLAFLIHRVSSANAPSRFLHIRAMYPSHILDVCNASLAVAVSTNNYKTLGMNRSTDELWTAALMYKDSDVGRQVEVTFNFNMSSLPSTECQELCGLAGGRDLGARTGVELLAGSTELLVYPYFCNYQGRVKKSTLYSPQLDNNRPIYTYIPPSLVENPLRRHIAVAVLHDGQVMNVPGVSGILDSLVAMGDIKEAVVIGIDSSDPHIANYRGALLTPSSCTNDCTCPIGANNTWCNRPALQCSGGMEPSGNGTQYMDFISDTVLPAVTKDLGIRTTADDTASWGYSLGGLTAWWHAYTAPKVFGKAVAGSPSLWWNCGKTLSGVAALPPTSKLYIDVGSAEGPIMYIPARQLYEQLLHRQGFADGVNVFLSVGEGDHHDTNGFLKRMPRALKSLFPPNFTSDYNARYTPPNLAWGPDMAFDPFKHR
jgi:enterochelin esterase-like enzyme